MVRESALESFVRDPKRNNLKVKFRAEREPVKREAGDRIQSAEENI